MSWLGNGLVEVAALTALVGSSTAEQLTLGHRGGAGLPWAAISSFGTISLLKACLAACTPCWLQDALGTQLAGADVAFGFRLSLKGKKLPKSSYQSPVGVVHSQTKPSKRDQRRRYRSPGYRSRDVRMEAVYKFDAGLSALLNICPSAVTNLPVKQHSYMVDPHWKIRHASRTKRDWITLLASMVKISETFTLRSLGANSLQFIGVLPWLFFFVSALSLQILGISRECHGKDTEEEIDVLAGKLPTPLQLGGEPKVLFDVRPNVRSSLIWYLAWSIGGLLCLSSLIIACVMLSQSSPIVVYVWLGFQILWVGLRSVVSYLSEEINDAHAHVTLLPSWKDGANKYEERLMRLAMTVSKYQVLSHSRGPYCYEDDLQDAVSMANLLQRTAMTERILMPDHQKFETETIDAEFTAVVGDTLFSSVAWISGLLDFDREKVFDSCLVEVKINTTKWLVPGARVTSERPSDSLTDTETAHEPVFIPKSGSNEGTNTFWVYWLPFAMNEWLEIKTKATQSIGKHSALLLTDIDLTARLARGDLWISIGAAEEVYEIVKTSRIAAGPLFELCKAFRTGR